MTEVRKRRGGEAATPAKPASSDGGRGKGRVPAPVHVAEPAMTLEQNDWIAMACLVVLCGFTRFWRLDKPPGKHSELACRLLPGRLCTACSSVAWTRHRTVIGPRPSQPSCLTRRTSGVSQISTCRGRTSSTCEAW